MPGERAGSSHGRPGSGGHRRAHGTSVARPARRGPAAPVSPPRAPSGSRDNLPVTLSSFVGREREVAEVHALLEAHRLVTLVGAPGVGKTRLALRVAEACRNELADGVRLVELAPLASSSLVAQVVATAVGVRETPDRTPTAAIVDALRPARMLLVLDNCEHLVVPSASLIFEILRSCPEVRILATSREVLSLAGEATWQVPSLSLPAPEQADDPSRLMEAEAVRLFAERARLVVPRFTVDDRNAAAVAEVCRRLDGIPLAIELAAARVKVLTPAQIAARLDDRFRLLTGGDRSALPHRRTLRGAIDWSHDLLSEEERRLLRRLAVFAGGWTAEAAERVCSGDGIASDEMLDLLAQLVGKSLVLAESGDGAMRYRFLETVRQYADEELRAVGEVEAVRRRHCDWLVDLAEEAEAGLVGPEQLVWLDRLEREHDNLRSALRFALGRAEAEIALRLGGAIWRFWYTRGYLSEGQDWLEAALSLDGAAESVTPVARAKALNAAGNLALARGLYDQARAFHEAALTIWREIGDPGSIAMALYSLGRVAHRTGDYATARAINEESLVLRRALDDTWGIGVALNMLGEIARAQGDYATAARLYEEGVERFRAAGAARGVAIATHNLGIMARVQGDYGRATALHHAALPLFHELGDKEQIACSLIKLAHLALIGGDLTRATRLSGAVAALREAIGTALLPDERADHEQTVRALQAKQGPEAFAAAWATGQALSLDEAVAAGLATPEPSSDAPSLAPRKAVSGDLAKLSPREHEIVALVGQGLTNRQIAERLAVSPRTVEWHVANLLGKLQLENKSQLTVWASRHSRDAPSEPVPRA